MPAAEIPFEINAAALETTRGTAITNPTHLVHMVGNIKPVRDKYRPDEARGTLEEWHRSKTTRTRSEFDLTGPADPNMAPFWYNLIGKSYSTFTTPTNGVLTRLFTMVPTINADDIKSATLWGGDPNVQVFRSAYCMADEFTLSADALSEDGVTWGIKGQGFFPEEVADPTYPASIAGSLLVPGAMQLWIDSGATAIGTTEVTGRFISTEWTLATGVTRKHYANGPTGGLNYTKTGRSKRHGEASIVVELNDVSIAATKEYQLWKADTTCKMRIRINGDLIESVTPDYYEYLQLDIYGPLDALEWGEAEESNRTMEFTVQSEYNSTAGASWVLYAQSQRTTI